MRPAATAAKIRRIVLVGRPNVGKSVLFHALTGRYETVSNYSGTTMDLRRSKIEGGDLEVIDTPGLFSLAARTEDEMVTREVLLDDPPDCVVHVANACDLVGSLTLTLELSRLAIPVILLLNLWDEAQSRGIDIDVEGLSRALGIPVATTVATKRIGISRLRELLRGELRLPKEISLPMELRRSIAQTRELLPKSAKPWAALAFTGDDGIRRALKKAGRVSAAAFSAVEKLRTRYSRRPEFLYMNAIRSRAQELAARMLSRRTPSRRRTARLLERLGRWSLHPVWGSLFSLLVLWMIYKFVGVFGAQTAVEFIEGVLFGQYINPAVIRVVEFALPWSWARDMLVGPYGIFTMAITYAFALVLPIVTTFFFAFGILEDSGYLPRFSVVTDRFFRLMGLNGKAVLPMLLGLGCGTMAVVTTRILESRRERLLVTLLLCLTVPCSAQLGVILGMAGGSTNAVLLVWLGVVAISLLGVGWAGSRVMPGAVAPFIIDIPPVRIPQLSNVLRKVGQRLKWYLIEVVPLFVYATVALFFLDRTGGLKAIERAAAPLIQGLLGLPGEATGAFLMGFLRRDYGAAGLFQLFRDGLLSPRQVAVSLICITLFMPCVAQWLITLRTHGWKVTTIITAFVITYALAVAGFVNWAWRIAAGA